MAMVEGDMGIVDLETEDTNFIVLRMVEGVYPTVYFREYWEESWNLLYDSCTK